MVASRLDNAGSSMWLQFCLKSEIGVSLTQALFVLHLQFQIEKDGVNATNIAKKLASVALARSQFRLNTGVTLHNLVVGRDAYSVVVCAVQEFNISGAFLLSMLDRDGNGCSGVSPAWASLAPIGSQALNIPNPIWIRDSNAINFELTENGLKLPCFKLSSLFSVEFVPFSVIADNFGPGDHQKGRNLQCESVVLALMKLLGSSREVNWIAAFVKLFAQICQCEAPTKCSCQMSIYIVCIKSVENRAIMITSKPLDKKKLDKIVAAVILCEHDRITPFTVGWLCNDYIEDAFVTKNSFFAIFHSTDLCEIEELCKITATVNSQSSASKHHQCCPIF
ncbi:hypothetical protein HK096_006231 [Nowakowskiella sp. JEL0078]|nr:hypothetical protein HK096_006231 [Nowakowskiella sp. JEL0078]